MVRQADALQYELGEGPCLTARAAEETVIVVDVRTDPRWPEWSAAVEALPVRSVVSTALVSGKECIGALKVYAAMPAAYDEATARMLKLFAGPAATQLSHIQTSEAPHRISDNLQSALYSRDVINRASGILMERQGMDHEDAIQVLMGQARDTGDPLQKVAADLIAGSEYEAEAYLQGLLSLPALQRDSVRRRYFLSAGRTPVRLFSRSQCWRWFWVRARCGQHRPGVRFSSPGSAPSRHSSLTSSSTKPEGLVHPPCQSL